MDMDDKVHAFFTNRPEAYRLFKIVRNYLETFGAIKMEVMKTQISFGTKRKFTWIWLPQTWIKKRSNNSITVTFVLRRRITNKRIEEAIEPRPSYWTHHVLIQKERDLDQDLRDWLHEAYINSLD